MTLDLSNPDRLPLRDLPDDVAAGMFLAWRKGAVVEFLAGADNWFAAGSEGPVWNQAIRYRIRPEPVTADVIPWAHIDPQWKWVARDDDGVWYGYRELPTVEQMVWTTSGRWRTISGIVAGFVRGTCAWRDSLQQRPEGV